MAESTVELKLIAKAEGTAEIAALNQQLKFLNEYEMTQGRAQQIARGRRSQNIALMTREMQIKGNLINVDTRAEFLQARMTVEYKNRMTLLADHNNMMQRAVVLQDEHNMKMNEAIALAKQERENNLLMSRTKKIMGQEAEDVDIAFMKRKQELIAIERIEKEGKKELLMNQRVYRQELMQASIGMFVMGITMTQTLDTMGKMAGKGTQLEAVFKDMSQAVRFTLGPIQVVTAAMQFLNQANKAMMMTMVKTMGLFAGMYLLYKAFTTESKALRAVFGAIAGVLIVLNGLLLINTARTWAKTIADIVNKSVSTFGTALPVLAAAVGGGLALGLAAYATAPKGQTVPGYSRPVNNTGLVYAHRGEVISRIGSMGPQGGSTTLININVPESSIVNTDMVDYMTRQLEIVVASGRGG